MKGLVLLPLVLAACGSVANGGSGATGASSSAIAASSSSAASASSGGRYGSGYGAATPAASAPVATPAPAVTSTLGVGSSGLGQILVAANGKTLYLFEKDMTTQSTCYGACAQFWPPLTTSVAPTVGSGLSQSLIGTSRRTDGTTQVTYAGHPLYFFVSDAKPGDTTGEGSTAFGAGWDVLAPSGAKIDR
jgi:predicted lipoprotein with Yx(FWY)xxD motif